MGVFHFARPAGRWRSRETSRFGCDKANLDLPRTRESNATNFASVWAGKNEHVNNVRVCVYFEDSLSQLTER